MYRNATNVLSLLLVIIGVGLVVRTLGEGGGPAAVGVLLGVLFAAVGFGRLWIARRTR